MTPRPLGPRAGAFGSDRPPGVVPARLSSPPAERAIRTLARLPRPQPYSGLGLALAVSFCTLALTPSLLPRPPAFQGLVCGAALAIGYLIGSALLHAGGRVVRARPSAVLARRARRVTLVAGTLALSFMLVRSREWQREAHLLVGKPPPEGESTALIVGLAGLIFVVVVGLGRALCRSVRLLADPLSRTVPRAVAVALAVTTVLAAALVTIERAVAGPGLTLVDRFFAAANDATADGVQRPTSALRSGGPDSQSPWQRLGLEGQRFVAGGPSVGALADFHGPAVREPIRVYAGLDIDRDLHDLAALAVADLDRTGGFDRAVLCVVVPTGRGWVNPAAAAALEYLWAGDSAIVSLQYSYLPSALEFLIDAERARAAGRALFDAVHARWSEMPPTTRPHLLIYGESLGSTGAQAPFRDLADLRSRTGGALFVGPPQSNRLWREHMAARDVGSPMTRPVVDRGRVVRFGSTVDDVHRPDLLPWERPRVLFLHHPSDAVVWWSPSLLLRRPAWLSEPRGHDVSPRMRWYPVVTFLQVTGDLAVSNSTPTGHGHRYGDFVTHWAALASPPGWTDQDTDRLNRALS